MDLFWLVIVIGYFLFRVLAKKLPDMTKNFPGDWDNPEDVSPVSDPEHVPRIERQLKRGSGIKQQQGDLWRVRREGESSRPTAQPDPRPRKQLEPQFETQPETIGHRDWVNGIIMSEVLQPPLAKRKKR